MATENVNSNPHDSEDDEPASNVYPTSQKKRQELNETASSHIDPVIQNVTKHSDQPIEPAQQYPASSLFGRLRVGSRNSKLALIQASSVTTALFKEHPHYTIPISTHKV